MWYSVMAVLCHLVLSPRHITKQQKDGARFTVISLCRFGIHSYYHLAITTYHLVVLERRQNNNTNCHKNSHHSMIHTGVTNLRLPQCELCIQFLPRNNWVHLSGMCNPHSGEAIWYFYSLGSTREVSMWST